jgi:hypothetical protein
MYSIIRRNVREKDRAQETKADGKCDGRFISRIIEPTEKPKKNNEESSSAAAKSPAADDVHQESGQPENENGIEGPLPYPGVNFSGWMAILDEAQGESDGGEEEQEDVMEEGIVPDRSPEHGSIATELIAEPDRQPFPDFNQRNFPQENIRMSGIRGWKVKLADLFPVE